MTAIITDDSCQNEIKVVPASEPQLQEKNTLETPTIAPEPASVDSISMRRDRSLTAFLFEEIAGKKLKCYEKWKLWLGLFICMTFVAVIAIAFASYYAIKINTYESKTQAVNAQSTLLYDIVHDDSANFSDHSDETHKIFNTFDDNADGVWSSDEFYDHFILGSISIMFDDIDENEDDILSWSEIVSSISRHSLSQSYMGSVYSMYNYTFTNSTDPLLNNYAANVYLDYYNIEEFGYITRAYFYEFRSNLSFKNTDSDNNNLISFDEFAQKIGNDRLISLLRVWDLESYLESVNQTDSNSRQYTIPNPTSSGATNMCPYNVDSCSSARRLYDISFNDWGELVYDYNRDGCEAQLICSNDRGSYWGEDVSIEDNCDQQAVDGIVECMTTVLDMYFDKHHNIINCWKESYACVAEYESWDCKNIHCHCSCSEECVGILTTNVHQRTGYSRGGDCGRKSCACGSGCTCFGGNNEMWIKRDDVIQNVLLKDLRIGDYAQTKEGEWSKVWFIKEEEESEYEFLKLYFDDNEYITMTNHHLLYVDDMMEEHMKRADEVKVGNIVFVTQNGTLFVEKEIVFIESTISSDGAYAPVTMEGSIVVNNVLASCYVESPEKAQRLHDTAAVFRWISSYNTNLASVMTHFFYDSFFMKLRTDYGLDAAHVVFNAYSMPCIVVATINIAMFGFIRSFSYFF